MKRLIVCSLLLPLVLLGAACELQKSENILSPSIAGPVPGVEITAPKVLEPGTGWQISGTQQPITLLLENSSSNSPRPMSYTFEVATDPDFNNKVFAAEGIQPGDNGRTALRLPDALAAGRVYYWRAKAQDGANAGPYSAPAAFNLFTPVSFDRPTPRTPTNNDRTESNAPEFRWLNAPHAGSPNYVAYAIEVAANDSFSKRLASWQIDEQPGGETRFTSPSGFPSDAQIFWRVRAFEGGNLGPWSNTAVFRTPKIVVVEIPTGGGSTGGGGVPPGAPCNTAKSELDVIKCRRAQFQGHMNEGQTLQFLKGVASDLNSKFRQGPYGIWKKTGGNNCGGYSCDLICAMTGASWDVLYNWEGDQDAIWLSKGIGDNSKCEVVR